MVLSVYNDLDVKNIRVGFLAEEEIFVFCVYPDWLWGPHSSHSTCKL